MGFEPTTFRCANGCTSACTSCPYRRQNRRLDFYCLISDDYIGFRNTVAAWCRHSLSCGFRFLIRTVGVVYRFPRCIFLLGISAKLQYIVFFVHNDSSLLSQTFGISVCIPVPVALPDCDIVPCPMVDQNDVIIRPVCHRAVLRIHAVSLQDSGFLLCGCPHLSDCHIDSPGKYRQS